MKEGKAIYGLIGCPVRHSLSPLMQGAAFRALGIPAEYRLFEIKNNQLGGFLLDRDYLVEDVEGNAFCASEVRGFNITIPYKVKAREILEKRFPLTATDTLAEEDYYYVRLSGAVNTVKREGDIPKYCNTDAGGFLRSLNEDLKFDPKGKRVIVFGCGGAGRAVIAALSWRSVGVAKIYVYEIWQDAIDSARRDFSQFPHIKETLEFISLEGLPEAIKDCQLLVNATNVGMKESDGSIIGKELLHKELYVYDVIYHRQTQLLVDARARGKGSALAEGGLGMLLYQGAAAFEFWTGKQAPLKKMRAALKEGTKDAR